MGEENSNFWGWCWCRNTDGGYEPGGHSRGTAAASLICRWTVSEFSPCWIFATILSGGPEI